MATKILIPNGAGSLSEFSPHPAVANYLNIDDIPSDGIATHNAAQAIVTDLFSFPAADLPEGAIIDSITVFVRAKLTENHNGVKAVILSGETTDTGEENALTSVWTTYSETWATNPDTAAAWEEAEVDALKKEMTEVPAPNAD